MESLTDTLAEFRYCPFCGFEECRKHECMFYGLYKNDEYECIILQTHMLAGAAYGNAAWLKMIHKSPDPDLEVASMRREYVQENVDATNLAIQHLEAIRRHPCNEPRANLEIDDILKTLKAHVERLGRCQDFGDKLERTHKRGKARQQKEESLRK